MDLLGQAIGVDRQFPVPFEGVSKYRYAISHPIKMPIGQVYAIGFCPWRPTFRFWSVRERQLSFVQIERGF